MKTAILSLCTIISLCSFAQDDNWMLYKNNTDTTSLTIQLDSVKSLNYSLPEGNILIDQPSELDSLSSKRKNHPFIYGYTLQIEVSQQKTIIRNSRYRFIKNHPGIPLESDFESPNTYLYAGRFYDRFTAFQFKNEIKKTFPNAIVIKKKLDLPVLPESAPPAPQTPEDQ